MPFINIIKIDKNKPTAKFFNQVSSKMLKNPLLHFILVNCFLVIGAIFLSPITEASTTIKTSFEYSLKVNVDYSKRDSYLKRYGVPPSNYETLLKSINGTVEVADLVDSVNFSSNTYSIRSVGTPKGVVGYALYNQQLIRDSLGKLTREGYSSLIYQEARGKTEPFQARVDHKKNLLNFTTNNTSTGQTPIQNRLVDPLLITYAFIGKDLPVKSFTTNFTDGRSLKKYTVIRAESLNFNFYGETIKAIRFYKTTSKEDDTTLQVWFSEKEHVPLRYIIGLKDEYGITIQVDLKKMPKLP